MNARAERGGAIAFQLPLRGAGGEPVDFARTVFSHGCAQLPPASIETSPLTYRYALRLDGRTVTLTMRAVDGELVVSTEKRLSKSATARARAIVERMFRLHADLSEFYARIDGDAALGWAKSGAGRMLASPTVFEDVIKTICTTNCAWSATVRMADALVGKGKGAFPDAQLLAKTPDAWFRDVARMGYRGPYVRAIARDVANGALDLERLLPRGNSNDCTDDEVEEALLALPGIGPYGAAHVMQVLGRHRNLVLDSWTRPKYLKVSGKRRAADATIRRAFARYREYAGLAFWLYLTRDWLDESTS